MKKWWRPSSVRVRLALWFAGALAAILVIYSIGVFSWLKHDLVSHVDKQLYEDYEASEDKLKLLSNGKLERLSVENPDDELGKLASTFNDTFARLERSFEQMRRFSADASHELRTPLTAIRSVGEVYLKYKSPDKKGVETVSSMLEEVARMQQLIEMLLTLSRADSGQITKVTQNEDLKILTENVLKYLEVLADEKKQNLKLDFNANETVIANIDPLILRQAVINLVDNAIKYSPVGSTIDVRVRQEKGNAVIEVSDHGSGISKEHLPRIFDRFYRVDKSRTRSQGSFGLGLAIAMWATEINNGKLDVTSTENSGTTFRIIIPSSERVGQS